MRCDPCLMVAFFFLAAAASMASRDAPAADAPKFDLTEWTPPQLRSVGDDPFGKLVKYGYALMVDTSNQIGPTVADPVKAVEKQNAFARKNKELATPTKA